MEITPKKVNDWRVFPRLALVWLLCIGTDAYWWAKENVQADDVQWFVNLTVGAVIAGVFGYMKTGLSND